jgi:protein arginine kinase activator
LIQQEVFEEAAVVRDKIRELEQSKGEKNHDA